MRRAALHAGYRVMPLLSALWHGQCREDRSNAGPAHLASAPPPTDRPLAADAALQRPVSDLWRRAARDHLLALHQVHVRVLPAAAKPAAVRQSTESGDRGVRESARQTAHRRDRKSVV